MKIQRGDVKNQCIEAFAEEHGLVMKISERKKPVGDPSRYYASFKSAEVKDGPVLIGKYGNGKTPEEAIKEYAKEIDMKILVIDAFGPGRREIDVPRLVF